MLSEWSTLISVMSAAVSAISTVACLWVTWKLFCEQRNSSNRFYLDSRTPNIVVTSAKSSLSVSIPHLPEFIVNSIQTTPDNKVKCNNSYDFKVTEFECNFSMMVTLYNYSLCGGKISCHLLSSNDSRFNDSSISETIVKDKVIKFNIVRKFTSIDDLNSYVTHPSSQVLIEVVGFGLSAKDTIIIEIKNRSTALSNLLSEAELYYNEYRRTYPKA